MRLLRFLEIGAFFALLAIIYTQILVPLRYGRPIFPIFRRLRKLESATAAERQRADELEEIKRWRARRAANETDGAE